MHAGDDAGIYIQWCGNGGSWHKAMILILMIKISLTLWGHYKVNNSAWFYLKHSLRSLLSSILKDWPRPYLLFYIACALSIHLNYTPSEQHVHHTHDHLHQYGTVVRIMTIFTGLSIEHAHMHMDNVSLHT